MSADSMSATPETHTTRKHGRDCRGYKRKPVTASLSVAFRQNVEAATFLSAKDRCRRRSVDVVVIRCPWSEV